MAEYLDKSGTQSLINEIKSRLGNKVDKVAGMGLSQNSYTNAEKSKLAGLATVATTGSYSDLSNKPTVDSTLSSSSTNAIQNKAVYAGLAKKVDTVDGMGLSQNSYTNAEKSKLAGLTNYDDTQMKSTLAEIVDSGAKNKIKISLSTNSSLGITYTDNNDGTFTANGTSTGSSNINCAEFTPEKSGSYVLSGCPTGGGGSTYELAIQGGATVVARDYGNSVRCSLTAGTTYSIKPIIRNAQNVSNLIFSPMVTTSEEYEISPDFKPYAPTNAELYEMIKTLQG